MKPLIKDFADKNEEFQKIIENVITNETVQQMKNYRKHYETKRYEN